jgi:hypothetical protein
VAVDVWVAPAAWPLALGAVLAWTAAVTVVLRARGWAARPLGEVAGAPAVVLALPAVAGWLSPEGLVLWAPLTTVLAVGLGMVARPSS